MAYLRPTTLDAALDALDKAPWVVLAGGTDHFPARVGRRPTENVLDIGGLAALRRIEDRGDHWRLGAGVTWSDLIAADLPPLFDGLKQAAREIGGKQIQNAGTIVGNVCNASPAADGVPPLLCLGASLVLASREAALETSLERFIEGPRRVQRQPNQIVTGILVPKPKGRAVGGFAKLGARRYLVISIVMAAALLEIDDAGAIAEARIAVGACSPVARRLPVLEMTLLGRVCDGGLGRLVEPDHLAPLHPIDDIRADADYRRDAAVTIVSRLLAELGRRLGSAA